MLVKITPNQVMVHYLALGLSNTDNRFFKTYNDTTSLKNKTEGDVRRRCWSQV